MDPIVQFENEVQENVRRLSEATELRGQALAWMLNVGATGSYTYNFKWMGRPIIQYPQDMVAMQELIWQIQPDLIIETGIAHGGSLVFSATMLAMLDLCDAIESGSTLKPAESARRVLGIDIDIRDHNRAAIEAHPMASRIQMIQGSSIDAKIIEQVHAVAKRYSRILVCLDSNHSHEHVMAELQAYANLTSVNSYCVVFDTVIDDMPAEMCTDRPWGAGNSPRTAVDEFLKTNDNFEINDTIDAKLQITVARGGYLRRVA